MFKNLLNKLKSRFGAIGVPLKYGKIKGQGLSVSIPLAASVIIKNNYGKFATIDSNGRAALTVSTDTTIAGSLEGASAGTYSATAGADVVMMDIGLDCIYRLPISSGTYSHASYRGHTCDLTTSSGAQAVVLGTDTYHHVQIVDGDTTNNTWVDVRINPAIIAK